MDKKKLAGTLMFVGGCIELMMAVTHFLMPIQIGAASEIADMPRNYRDLFMLETFAIGVSLVVFGVLSIYFSRRLRRGDRSAWIFGMAQGILWLGRTILELLFPVTVPLFFLPNPTVMVLPTVIFLGLLFLVPLLVFKNEFAPRAGSRADYRG